jgi:hypothetical protein
MTRSAGTKEPRGFVVLVHPIPRQEMVRWAVCDWHLLPERRKRRCTLPLSLAGSDAARGGCLEERLPLAAD